MRVVMIDDGSQRREPAVVIEAALRVGPEPAQRCGTVSLIGRARSLELVDADLRAGVHVPAGLGEERRHVTTAALGSAVEQGFTVFGSGTVVAAARRRGYRQRELVDMQS